MPTIALDRPETGVAPGCAGGLRRAPRAPDPAAAGRELLHRVPRQDSARVALQAEVLDPDEAFARLRELEDGVLLVHRVTGGGIVVGEVLLDIALIVAASMAQILPE
jgi:hypothetical protein